MPEKIIITTRGGIGDVLLCTPAIKALKETHPRARMIVYCLRKDHRQALLGNPYIDSLRMLAPLYLIRYPYHLYCYLTNKPGFGYFFNPQKLKYYRLNFGYVPVALLYDKSIKEIVPEIFNDIPLRMQDKRIQLFFSEREEAQARKRLEPYRNVILMHIYSRSSQNHMWPQERWERLIQAMPGYTFIQVGNRGEPLVKGAVDWRGKMADIRDVFCLLKYCLSFVGVDSCVAHATNAVGMPGVVLFGDTNPVHWGHDNNINIYKGLSCSPCHHFVEQASCPYHHECMEYIGVEEVKNALCVQIAARRGWETAVAV
ncbi:glycosyltransferase family 9 protein [Paraflavitalea pollutisoli]|uniref:glycosyltransferase family 9 protein n=1 Tax=Paraflavitalea pollutisoli TaxID=3034143 RepID=UPI0023EC9F47|nr:glycosyltransferase family 9 protein [Paraflavitalea sp. H1-2-19X]